MHLAPYVDALRHELSVAAEAGGEDARALAERLVAPLESAAYLVLLNALSAAADEITLELAPGSVDVRLRGLEPEFVVTAAPSDDSAAADVGTAPVAVDDTATATARINLRLSEQLKQRVDERAARDGVSVNTWLVRAAAAALERGPDDGRHHSRGERYKGWVR